MLLAVISDTHLYEVTPWFAKAYEAHLARADLLIHCGDMAGRPLWSYLMRHPGFHGARGNMDDYGLREELPQRVNLRIEGLNVSACHGWGPRPGLSKRVAEAFGHECDLIFFGHSHAQEDVQYGATRLVNPGSFQEGSGRFAYVRIENGEVTVDFRSVG